MAQYTLYRWTSAQIFKFTDEYANGNEDKFMQMMESGDFAPAKYGERVADSNSKTELISIISSTCGGIRHPNYYVRYWDNINKKWTL